MWAKRAARARELAERYPATREILLFYAQLADWQGEAAKQHAAPQDLLWSLVGLVDRTGPATLREAARGLVQLPHLHAPPPFDFFARAARQPFAETLRPQALPAAPASAWCPWCSHPPQVGCLQTQGEGQSLELVCSLCFGRWPFPRSRCVACGPSAEGRPVFYTAPEFPYLRVEACEACHTYLQVVDLTREPAAIPEVDELAGLPLDLWAHEHGYRKRQRNLAGI